MAALPPVLALPSDELGVMAVVSRLDPMDHIEAELARGVPTNHLAIFAGWRAQEPVRVVSLVLCTGTKASPIPFAVLAMSNTGQAGVAQAALLARNHSKFRRPLLAAALLIRERMPDFCAEHGIHRVEARSWREHPRAASFLRRCGFSFEADMPGFGADGTIHFSQFAWTHPTPEKDL